jgi:hypothetical protein
VVAKYPRGNGVMLPADENTDTLGRHMTKAYTRHKRAASGLERAKNRLKVFIADADGIEGLATFRADKRGVRSLKAVGGKW